MWVICFDENFVFNRFCTIWSSRKNTFCWIETYDKNTTLNHNKPRILNLLCAITNVRSIKQKYFSFIFHFKFLAKVSWSIHFYSSNRSIYSISISNYILFSYNIKIIEYDFKKGFLCIHRFWWNLVHSRHT